MEDGPDKKHDQALAEMSLGTATLFACLGIILIWAVPVAIAFAFP
jgi:hypothetical protein